MEDLSYFKRFEVNQEIDTVVWPNGADFSPDFLYDVGVGASRPGRAADAASPHG